MVLAKIVLDETLYPRHKISDSNVSQLVEAIKAGAILPPIILDEKTLKVIDGWHRVEAYRKVNGETAEVDVELHKYETKQAMFIDAVKRNAIQGYKLTTWDRVRSIIMLEELGASVEKIGKTLSLTKQKTESLLRDRVAIDGQGNKVALKGSMESFSGKKLDDTQRDYNEGVGVGVSLTTLLSQIIRALEANVVNRSDPRIIDRFSRIIELWG
jgi:hypothetical protein